MRGPEKEPKDEMIDAVQETPASRTSPVPTGLKELLEFPGVLSLAADLPAAELFPMSAVAQASARLLADPAGFPELGTPFQPLKAQVVDLMAMRGIRCRPEQIVLTTGVEGALDLLGRLLLDPGSQVLLEETVSDKVRAALPTSPISPEILTVSTDPTTGIDVDQVEALLAGGARPAFLYVIPEGHNPLGVSLGLEKRLRLLDLARAYEVPILEDDTYGFLSYDGHPEPPLRALDSQWVVYLGSFSMLLAPALRAGWIVLPDNPPARLALLPEAAELDVPSFSHRTISAFLEAGYLPEHLETIRAAYRRRRDTLLRTLQEHFPRGARWSHPSSGLYVWVELPAGIASNELLRDAVAQENVAFTPGSVFATRGGSHADQALRLSFGNNPPHRIEEGVQRLARVLQAKLA